jgi:hypothetical protein
MVICNILNLLREGQASYTQDYIRTTAYYGKYPKSLKKKKKVKSFPNTLLNKRRRKRRGIYTILKVHQNDLILSLASKD